ncbi:TetR/AcrR family transcriptional regulator [Pelagibacterium flavum]|uniref:TetR/AcrR family transcriptional regulator n=1 Tax=Pelagibacterium flavum TaxID=2984530 RepID=A0ABY6IQE0_9HYPH|nr:TetR/AcrR family transcriptional regulator [Pelagibacterium sp. YIM 151497]UYQ72686.1 TetR/AcrR family transcriptional regulator [Pelagibacterium sp. YIM 151497]|tara:strand:- start:3757 stop:4326 length:570 start_codon:yes stop_codon:yes gene_type:complete
MPRAGLNKDVLVQAAAEMADEIGFGNLTLAALARRFDVKLASLYSHLENSDDLKVRVALFGLDLLADRAEEAVAGRAGKDALVAVANVHRDFAHHHPGLFEAARHRLDQSAARESGGARVSRITRNLLRGYGLSETDQVHAVRLLGSVFLGYPMLELAGSFAHSDPDARLSWQYALDALDAALRSWSRA